jgi:hypothetical protein
MPVPKKVKICFLAVFILNVMMVAPAAPAQRPLLLTVAGTAPEARQAVAAAGGVVVQELRTCLLVTAPPAALSRLRSTGVRPEVIAAPAAGESFFLLHTELSSPLPVPQAGIRCRQLEEGLWLLQTTDVAFRSRLTQPYRLKALQLGETFPGPLDPAASPPTASGETAIAGTRPVEAIPELVAQVSAEQLRADILALQDFKTRFASTPQCEAAGEFILERFRQLGLDALAEPFTFEARYQSRNILAVIPGSVAPERMVLACAHYDSTSNNRLVSAPGADDNASGTAAVLELARILAGERFDFSIGLLCVSAEEWGLYGSAYYARRARQQGAGIVAVINLDMVGYPGDKQRVLDVIGDRQSEWLADRFIAVAQPFIGLSLFKVINPSLTWSDHSSFWDQNYAALCGIEDSDNPYYHQTSDTLETLDMEFAVEAVKASLAVIADLAQPLSTPAAPTGLRARSQVSAALFTSRKSVYLEWDAGRAALAGYQVYRAVRSHGPYQRLTTQASALTSFTDLLLLPDQAYYYVVSAVDEQGRESNFSLEVRDDENN